MRILVTEDDADLRLAITTSLRGAGFAVDAAGDLPTADELLWVNDHDCAVFDRLLPGGDALDYVERKRRTGWTVPVLFLTALGDPAQRLAGLRRGGDDYLEKPFLAEEMVARVRSLCRRSGQPQAAVLRCAGVELDTGRREVRRAGVLLSLTRTEFDLLERLMTDAGRPVTRRDLVAHAWPDPPSSNALDVAIGNLRRKLGEPQPVRTVPKVGYVIDA
ncbi:response regulator transcription factor [Amycolatopsis australiensis]|uniref:response regulator transcription factor n=1 Tax=Amycolatopsis australiensis TaxID=546364 RepID=UPI0009319DCD|nr:response regulator transcription factor [Amycolatopsis australiensis]